MQRTQLRWFEPRRKHNEVVCCTARKKEENPDVYTMQKNNS